MAIDLTTGTDVALVGGPAPGKLDLDFWTSGPQKGNPRLSSDGTHAVVATCAGRRRGKRPGDTSFGGGYYYDPSGKRGTLAWTVAYDRSSTRGELVAAAQDAGQQLTIERYITSFSADATRKSPGRWRTFFVWTSPSGDRKDLTL